MSVVRHIRPVILSGHRGSVQYRKLLVHGKDCIDVINLDDILAVQAVGNYSAFLLPGEHNIFACKTLKHYETILPEGHFIRVHNSWLINIEKIVRIRKDKRYQVELVTGVSVPVSRSKKHYLLEHLQSVFL